MWDLVGNPEDRFLTTRLKYPCDTEGVMYLMCNMLLSAWFIHVSYHSILTDEPCIGDITCVVISYEIYQTSRGEFDKFHMK